MAILFNNNNGNNKNDNNNNNEMATLVNLIVKSSAWQDPFRIKEKSPRYPIIIIII